MKTKFIVTSVVFAIASFALGRFMWPDTPGMVGPAGNLIPFFIFISAIESISFGVGVAFLFFGYPLLKNVKAHKDLACWAFYSIVWMLVSWWPHDNMHRTNVAGDFVGLLHIEFLFHFTLIIAGFIVATYFYKQLQKS